MLRRKTKTPQPLPRFLALPESDKRAVKELLVLLAICGAAWVLIERTDTCTRFFQFVSAHPDMELDSLILAGIFSAVGLAVFALRRWSEAAKAECQSRHLAHHDTLTGLPNRRAFMEALAKATAGPNASPFACLLLDLDNFKQVNDLRGHLVGDRLLQLFSERIAEALSSDVLFARLGGDEYGILCDLDELNRPMSLATRVVRRLSEPFLIDGHAVQVGISVGVARFPEDATAADALLRKADIALYRCKARGRGQIRYFEIEMEDVARRHAEVAEALRDAIPRGEVVPHYQPLIGLATGEVIGFEVLARWQSPLLGPVAPSEFIPIAMDSGLIGKLCCQLLQQACTDAARWPRPLRISFNFAPRQLCDPLVPLQILSILSNVGLAPQRLDIEMTEDALLENDRTARTNLAALKAQGITLTLDDFGTGYSSLHHLRTLPFDKVKIDRSYVGQIADCTKSRLMVEAMIKLTHSLGMPVLAEGVETPREEQLLKELGCDFAQGWLYGKAVANSELQDHFKRPAGSMHHAVRPSLSA